MTLGWATKAPVPSVVTVCAASSRPDRRERRTAHQQLDQRRDGTGPTTSTIWKSTRSVSGVTEMVPRVAGGGGSRSERDRGGDDGSGHRCQAVEVGGGYDARLTRQSTMRPSVGTRISCCTEASMEKLPSARSSSIRRPRRSR